MMLMKDYVDVDDSVASYEELQKKFTPRVPEDFNFAFDVVDKYARLEAEKRAIVWCDDEGGERIFTFGELAKEVNKTAHFLKSYGIQKGDPVMLILRRRYEFWFFLLALHKIGAVAIPATNMLLQKDIEYRAEMAQIKMIVSMDDGKVQGEIEKSAFHARSVQHFVTVSGKKKGWISFKDEYAAFSDLFERPAENSPDYTKSSDTMLLYFTSGTSGEPKMVLHNFTYPLGHMVTAKYWHNAVEDGLHFTIAETGWAKAVWGKIYGQWLAGTAVFVYDMVQFLPSKTMEAVSKYRVTTFCAPPTVYRYLVTQDLGKYDLSALSYCTTAGEALNPEVANKFAEKTGLVIREGFGQTETTLIVGTFPWMPVKPGSMGKPAPLWDVDIVDGEGKSCDALTPGEIVLRLDKGRPCGLFAGYFKDEALTSNAFRNNLYHTGDVAYRDDEGYIYFSGRTDDMIKSAGYRISPFEVESALHEHPAVLECAVTGVYDAKRGQVVKATVVLASGYEPNPSLARELQDYVRGITAAYKYPRIIEFVDTLPKTISGKIQRAIIRLKEQYASQGAAQNDG